MNIEDQYRKPNLASEPFFYFNSDELEKNIAFVRERKIERLMLISNSNGYKLKNLDFLEQLPFIKYLEMGACREITDYEGLSFTPNLKTLVISPEKNVKVDLSSQLNLSRLGLYFSKNIKGLEKLINLEWIGVSGGTDDFFNIEIFHNYKNLKELDIGTSIIKNGLAFLKENISLEHLTFNHMKREFDLDGIQFLRGNLKKLKLISSKKIKNVNILSELTNLEWLILSESVILPSAKTIENMNKLEALTVSGSSYFLDGDLRSLKFLKDSITYYKVKDKKHYFYE